MAIAKDASEASTVISADFLINHPLKMMLFRQESSLISTNMALYVPKSMITLTFWQENFSKTAVSNRQPWIYDKDLARQLPPSALYS